MALPMVSEPQGRAVGGSDNAMGDGHGDGGVAAVCGGVQLCKGWAMICDDDPHDSLNAMLWGAALIFWLVLMYLGGQ